MLEKCERLERSIWRVQFQNWRKGLRDRIENEIDILKDVFELWRMECREDIFDLTECEEQIGL